LVHVCAGGVIAVTEALVCACQRLPQFPLRPYTPRQFPIASLHSPALVHARMPGAPGDPGTNSGSALRLEVFTPLL
jgi:hypothetical protein